jgi:starch phosphorylase
VVAPLYYSNRAAWIDVMRRTIAFNASFFNTQRMVQQYAASAYL